MTTENTINKYETPQEFVDAMGHHQDQLQRSLDKLPPTIVDCLKKAQKKTKDTLSLSADQFVVILGEQTYGLNERAKVLGKRVLAKGLELRGTQTLELFASYDTVGSEPAIYRMQLPHTQSDGGYVSLNILSGWKKKKNTFTNALRSPSEEEVDALRNRLSGSYRKARAVALTDFMKKNFEDHPESYAQANISMLREFENQIGLGIKDYITEDVIDSAIARNGGMEFMIYFWPKLIEEAKNYEIPGVRVPEIKDIPFFLYHETECNGRVIGQFRNSENGLHMDSVIDCLCLQCKQSETTTPINVVEEERNITWRAIPRVVAYSTIGIADGHITGGGSQYDNTAAAAMNKLGIPFFPITWMKRKGNNGEKENPFVYQSYVTTHGRVVNHPFLKNAQEFVKEGKAAMADLALSIGTNNLRSTIEEQLDKGVTKSTKIIFENNNQKDSDLKIF